MYVHYHRKCEDFRTERFQIPIHFQLVDNLKSLGAQGAAKLLQANISVLLGAPDIAVAWWKCWFTIQPVGWRMERVSHNDVGVFEWSLVVAIWRCNIGKYMVGALFLIGVEPPRLQKRPWNVSRMPGHLHMMRLLGDLQHRKSWC